MGVVMKLPIAVALLITALPIAAERTACSAAAPKAPRPRAAMDKTVEKLIDLLEDSPPASRRQAALDLNGVGRAAVAAIPMLIQVLEQDPDADVRGTAAYTLGGLGAYSKAGLDPLL